jgi:hypothetical protein
MPAFEVKFERVVKTYETCHRVIEAATAERAQEIANGIAEDFDRECPDDAEEVQGAGEFEDWIAEIGDETAEPVDYIDEDAAAPSCEHCGEDLTSNPCANCNGFNEHG